MTNPQPDHITMTKRKTIILADLLAKNPCRDGAEFAKRAKTPQKAWQTCKNIDWMIWALNAFELFDDKTARTFACDCAEHTLHFFEEKHPGDKRPRQALEASRRTITDQSPEALNARDAAWAAAWAAARDAAWAAARDAARDAAWAAARAAAWAAAWDAARAAETEWQCNRLRELINPFNS